MCDSGYLLQRDLILKMSERMMEDLVEPVGFGLFRSNRLIKPADALEVRTVKKSVSKELPMKIDDGDLRSQARAFEEIFRLQLY